MIVFLNAKYAKDAKFFLTTGQHIHFTLRDFADFAFKESLGAARAIESSLL